MSTTSYEDQQKSLAAFLDTPSQDFNERALSLFSSQIQTNAPYRAYCQSLQPDPLSITDWRQIPALPCDAFKYEPPVFCRPITDSTRHFLSSGTTTEQRSTHHFFETESYTKSILAGWNFAQLPRISAPYFLFQKPSLLPHSSLGFMFETLAKEGRATWLIADDGQINPHPLIEATKPLLLFSTAIGLLQLFQNFPDLPPLPKGSWVFQTGGYKGLASKTDPRALYGLIEKHLGVAPGKVINEYGMTELSSQAYSIGENTPHLCPPWLRFRIINPETGQEQPTGEEGYLCLYDLANLGSALAIRTQDIASAIDDDHFLLQGRDPHALPRGCSRTSSLNRS